MLKRSLTMLAGLCLVSFGITAEAHVNLNIDLAVSPAPPMPENVVMMPPQGYSSCYMTPGMWMGNVWVPPHQECQYQEADAEGPAVWVSGYWGCVDVGPGGGCGHWRWYGHRWAHGPVMGYNDHFEGHGFDHGYHHDHYDHRGRW